MKEFDELVRKYSERGEQTNIAIGLRPSGVIHLGNMASLTLAGHLGREIGPHLSEVDVTVCDLDMPDKTDWPIKEKQFVRYFKDLPDKDSCHPNLLSHSLCKLEYFLSGIEQNFGSEMFRINLLSDIQRKEGFRAGLKRVLDSPDAMHSLLRRVPKGKALVYPLCPECGSTNPRFSRYRDGVLLTSCTNPGCSQGEYEMNVLDCDKDLAVHFLIDPLRDRAVEPYVDVHVFGGDYREEHEDGPLSKAQKVLQVVDLASDSGIPDVLIGPTFYARDGYKMSKSKNNGLSFDALEKHFGDDYPVAVLNLVRRVVAEDIKHLDYRLVENYLFNH